MLVEYTGNKFAACGSTGEVKDANLGYGLSGGSRFYLGVDAVHRRRPQEQRGDLVGETPRRQLITARKTCRASVLNLVVTKILFSSADFRAERSQPATLVWPTMTSLVCGKGLITHDHFDGQRTWNYPASDRKSALKRLARLKGRPVLACGGANDFLREHSDLAEFTFIRPPVARLFQIPRRQSHPSSHGSVDAPKKHLPPTGTRLAAETQIRQNSHISSHDKSPHSRRYCTLAIKLHVCTVSFSELVRFPRTRECCLESQT